MGSIRIRAAALIRRGDEVLMIEHCKDGRTYWLLPGGGVEFGETMTAALEREMLEETNVRVKVGDLAFTSETIDPNGGRHVLHMVFWCEIVSGELRVGKEERLKSLRYVPVEELSALTMRPPIGEPVKKILEEERHGAVHLGSWCED